MGSLIYHKIAQLLIEREGNHNTAKNKWHKCRICEGHIGIDHFVMKPAKDEWARTYGGELRLINVGPYPEYTCPGCSARLEKESNSA